MAKSHMNMARYHDLSRWKAYWRVNYGYCNAEWFWTFA